MNSYFLCDLLLIWDDRKIWVPCIDASGADLSVSSLSCHM